MRAKLAAPPLVHHHCGEYEIQCNKGQLWAEAEGHRRGTKRCRVSPRFDACLQTPHQREPDDEAEPWIEAGGILEYRPGRPPDCACEKADSKAPRGPVPAFGKQGVGQVLRGPSAQSLQELGQGLEQISDQTVVGHLEDGGVAVLLMATMTFESFMPARCWMAPEMPMAK